MLQDSVESRHVRSQVGWVGTVWNTGKDELELNPRALLRLRWEVWSSRRHDSSIVAESLLLIHSDGRESSESSVDVCVGTFEESVEARDRRRERAHS